MLTEGNVYSLSLWMLGAGTIVVFLVVGLGLMIIGIRRYWKREIEYFDHFIHRLDNIIANSPNQALQLMPLASNTYSDYLSKRNDFWRSYGQIMLAILLLVFITILLLTKTIEPDAGLPILSGIAGFAIAKGGESAGMNSNPPRNLG